eukprot:CAMPEP_0114128732 /NCGR_PEP_ID=MMETSP0043_2-20121206/11093_1 /TAXON_ID=464988 /ORGANISM="Hemiselmis andersenii, Strain CCMP644" /LENGTH=87 /DNA_ID=CAMNT_0001221949 /DNA_START=62 /DNA_END=325 /DNA_ORIENTATION=+
MARRAPQPRTARAPARLSAVASAGGESLTRCPSRTPPAAQWMGCFLTACCTSTFSAWMQVDPVHTSWVRVSCVVLMTPGAWGALMRA